MNLPLVKIAKALPQITPFEKLLTFYEVKVLRVRLDYKQMCMQNFILREVPGNVEVVNIMVTYLVTTVL